MCPMEEHIMPALEPCISDESEGLQPLFSCGERNLLYIIIPRTQKVPNRNSDIIPRADSDTGRAVSPAWYRHAPNTTTFKLNQPDVAHAKLMRATSIPVSELSHLQVDHFNKMSSNFHINCRTSSWTWGQRSGSPTTMYFLLILWNGLRERVIINVNRWEELLLTRHGSKTRPNMTRQSVKQHEPFTGTWMCLSHEQDTRYVLLKCLSPRDCWQDNMVTGQTRQGPPRPNPTE
jgi:hypothetical protein